MQKLAPQWIVDDLEETLQFYTDRLGFSADWKGTMFAIISHGDATLMLRQLQKQDLKRPNRIPFLSSGWHTQGAEAWDAYVWVDNVDELFQELKKKKVSIIKELQNTEYGNLEFEIEDNNGYILCFGQTQ